MASDQRACQDCGNPYPFDDEPARAAAPGPDRPARAARGAGGPSAASGADGGSGGGLRSGALAGPLAALAPYRTVLVLVGVLVLIVAVGYALLRFGMSFFEAGRPDPTTQAALTPGVVVTPPALASPGPGASPSPGAGTIIAPVSSPSPAAGTRMKIANTDGQGANMRRTPSTTAPVVRTLTEGTVVEVIGAEMNAEGRSWRNVRHEQTGDTGWIASELLAPE
jgi:hypothetical protein